MVASGEPDPACTRAALREVRQFCKCRRWQLWQERRSQLCCISTACLPAAEHNITNAHPEFECPLLFTNRVCSFRFSFALLFDESQTCVRINDRVNARVQLLPPGLCRRADNDARVLHSLPLGRCGLSLEPRPEADGSPAAALSRLPACCRGAKQGSLHSCSLHVQLAFLEAGGDVQADPVQHKAAQSGGRLAPHLWKRAGPKGTGGSLLRAAAGE